MNPQQCDQLFSRLEPVDTPSDLLGRILMSIREESTLAVQNRRTRLLLAATVVMGAALVVTSVLACRDLYRAGFFDFAALAYSEPAAVAAAWKEYLMSLVESLPRLSLLLPLAVIFAYLELLKLIAGQSRLSHYFGLTKAGNLTAV